MKTRKKIKVKNQAKNLSPIFALSSSTKFYSSFSQLRYMVAMRHAFLPFHPTNQCLFLISSQFLSYCVYRGINQPANRDPAFKSDISRGRQVRFQPVFSPFLARFPGKYFDNFVCKTGLIEISVKGMVSLSPDRWDHVSM